MAPQVIWQQGDRCLVLHADGNFEFQTPGKLMWNGMAIGLPDQVFNGVPLQNDLTVTGDNGDGTVTARTVTLGDRLPTPTDAVVGGLPALDQLSPYSLPADATLVQPLNLTGRITLGGTSGTGTAQVLQLALGGTNSGPAGTVGALLPVTVALIDTRTGVTLLTGTDDPVQATVTDIPSGTGAPTLQTYDVALPPIDVPDALAPHVGIQISGGTHTDTEGVTHTLVVGYPSGAVLDAPATVDDTSQAFEVGLKLDATTFPLLSHGAVRLLAVVQDDVEMAPGKTLDGVDLSAFYTAYQTFSATVLATLEASQDGVEPTIVTGPTAPTDPTLGIKWVDTSGASPVWRYWNGAAWGMIALDGPDVDATFRNLTVVHDLTVGGQVTQDLELATGVKVGGIDLRHLQAQVASLMGGSLGTDLTLEQTLMIGQFQGVPVHDVDSTLFATGGTPDTLVTELERHVAQVFTATHTGGLDTVEVKLAVEAPGLMDVRVRRCEVDGEATTAPGPVDPAAGDPVVAHATKTFTAADVAAGTQVYTVAFPTRPQIAKQLVYYVEFVPREGAQLRFVVGEGIAPGRRYDAQAAEPTYQETTPDTDLVLRTTMLCTPTGAFTAIGDSHFFGDVTIEGRLILKDTNVVEIRSWIENLVTNTESLTFNGGVTATEAPTQDAWLIFKRGNEAEAKFGWNETTDRLEGNFPLYLAESGIYYPVATGEHHREKMIAVLAGLGFDADLGTRPDFEDTTLIAAEDTHQSALTKLDVAVAELTSAPLVQAASLFTL